MRLWIALLMSAAATLPDAITRLARVQLDADTYYGEARILSYRDGDSITPTGVLYIDINGIVYGVPAAVVDTSGGGGGYY